MDKDNTTYNLPKGWINSSIGEILNLQYGKSLPNKLRNSNGKYPVYGSNGIIGYHDEYLIEGPVIIVGRKGSVGAIHLEKDKCWPIDTTYYINIGDSVNLYFIFYLLKTLNLNKLDSSTAIPGINRNNIYEKQIILPSFNEQNRIITKIEELFSELDHAEAGLRKAQTQLEIYKQVLLKSSFQKREGYELVKVSELGTILTGNTPLKNNADFFGGEFNFYKPSDLNSGLFVVNSLDKLTSNGYKAARTAPEGSILVTCIGATIGKTGLIRKEGAFNQQINAIIPNQKILPEFIYYQIISPEFQLQLKQKTSSTTIPIINKGKFLKLNIILFPIDLQLQIVQELESKFTLIEHLEKTVCNGLKKMDLFRHLILKNAFEGKLVPQYSSDESATKLLQEIIKEKARSLENIKAHLKLQPKIKKMIEDNRSITDILKDAGKPVPTKELWQSSEFKDNIDAFYAQLKALIENNTILEIPRQGKESFIKLIKEDENR